MTKFNELSTNKLVELIGNEKIKIIDVRPIDAYNGWKLRNESRGGHIKGARTLPIKWTEDLDWIDTIHSNQIVPSHKIVVYGYTPNESRTVAELILESGYSKIFIYDHFIDEWSSKSTRIQQ
jgi:thiosulfate/3-mercaptopyruvate sulfurtransferase